jgi:uncharacterized protein YhfF
VSDCLNHYWHQFLASLPTEAERPQGFVEPVAFGFTAADATEIAKLVLDQIKTATGSLLWSYEADGKALPRLGDFWMVIDGDRRPVCIIRTTSVEIIPFAEVGEDYAWWGGEGDRLLETWRRIYWEYIGLECKRLRREPSAKAPLIMERFELVYAQPLETCDLVD